MELALTYCSRAGYEDVRDLDGQWIRIEIKKGDLIVLPPGMYHRFTLDENEYLKVSCTFILLSIVLNNFVEIKLA